MISKVQKQSLNKLKTFDVNCSQFIRDAIREKIQRDWKNIKENKVKNNCPF
jgi:hypothetical protein